MFSGVEEGSFRWAPSTAMFEALLGNGGGVLSYIEHLVITSICVLYWCDFKWFQMIVKFPGRSPNVWAPLRSFHCLCLCHVKFHQVQGAGASGFFFIYFFVYLCAHIHHLSQGSTRISYTVWFGSHWTEQNTNHFYSINACQDHRTAYSTAYYIMQYHAIGPMVSFLFAIALLAVFCVACSESCQSS